MRILLIDNHDSFTFNLFQMLAVVAGTEPVVLSNDDLSRYRAINSRNWDGIVISPGPGRPERDRDFGVSRRALARSEVPVLGVCLGFQGLCHAEGATVVHAPEPRHGRLSSVRHDGDALFGGIPDPFVAVRYHSLVVTGLPPSLAVTAWTEDGLPMAVRHRSLPRWGVQFHPESICTEHGHRLLGNFVELVRRHRPRREIRQSPIPQPAQVANPVPGQQQPTHDYQLRVLPLSTSPDTDSAYKHLFAADPGSFWLDSANTDPGLARFSFLGSAAGPLGELVHYDVDRAEVRIRGTGGDREQVVADTTVFDYLDDQLHRRYVPDAGLPFEFALGYVGYLGYELKADCGSPNAHTAPTPDAALAFCDRGLVVDHLAGCAWLLALTSAGVEKEAARWLRETARTVATLPASSALPASSGISAIPSASVTPELLVPRHDETGYRKLIDACLDRIRDGESYEICLTNVLSGPLTIDPLRVYRTLRRISPAPYSALLRFDELAVLSSSPERFLSIDREGRVESKPIKGTRARGDTPHEDATLAEQLREAEKDRAENLMIVDLVRNDLGRTARIGSVDVPKLFAVESYPTVHQLVSTIRSRLADTQSPVACVRAAFPGGSMTGAPKQRTLEILDELEAGPRGVYSGALGYFSLNGAVDLSIVIRTIVAHEATVSVGMGGAIVAQSEPAAEIDESKLKGRAMLRTLAPEAARPPESAPSAGRRRRTDDTTGTHEG